MLISPFLTRKSWILFLELCIAFIGLFAIYGVIMANDSYTYLNGSVRVSPLYPTLIALFRAIFSEKLYTAALVLAQELFNAYAIFSLIIFVQTRFSLRPAFAQLLALGYLGAYLLRLFLVGENALYCNTILTEAITYPLYFLFVKYAFAAWDQHNLRLLFTAYALAFLLACTRGQLICLILVLLLLFVIILRGRSSEKPARRRLWLRALIAGGCYALGIVLFSCLYHYALMGVASETTMGKETVLGALLYNSDAEDAALFPPDSNEALILREALTTGEAEGLTYRSAPSSFIGHFKHYEASHDELRGRLHTALVKRYQSEPMSDDAMRIVLAGYADNWIPVLLRENLGRYLANCVVNCLGGLVRTNSIMRRTGVLWSALMYALCILCLLLSRGRKALDGEKRFLSLILIASLVNAVFCSFGVFELSRYVYYNFPCLYLAIALYLYAWLIGKGKIRKQTVHTE